MKSPPAFLILKWGLGPIAVAALAGALGHMRADKGSSRFFQATAALSETERQAVESAPALAVANAIWGFGSEDSVRRMVRFELDRLVNSEGPTRARVFLRFGIIDTNPDGQAALFSQACADDPNVCSHDQLKAAAERETRSRFVPPGNYLPLFLIEGHPPLTGSR